MASREGMKKVAMLRIASKCAATSTLRSRIARRAIRLGDMIYSHDVPGAKAAYKLAMELGEVSWAGLDLARLFKDEGDVEGARGIYQELVNRDDDKNGVAGWDLARMLDDRG